MRLESACRPVFARHETFHPRYGWVKKAVDACEDPRLFSRDGAVIELGVGKNMVRSIRFWGTAFKVLASVKEPGSRTPLAVPSAIGHILFADGGWDPYCEQPSTKWLLHWWLLANRCSAPAWWLTFNEFPAIEFTSEDLELFLAERLHGWASPHPSAIRKDVSCLLRMYAGGQGIRAAFDDTIDCPFRELGLILHLPGPEARYRFVIGNHATLVPSVVAFACLDFVARGESTARTATVSRLASEPGSPGRVFKLTTEALLQMLDSAAESHDEISITSAAGAPQLVFDGEPAVAATELLYDYYRGVRPDQESRFPGWRLVAGPTADEPMSRGAQLDLSEAGT